MASSQTRLFVARWPDELNATFKDFNEITSNEITTDDVFRSEVSDCTSRNTWKLLTSIFKWSKLPGSKLTRSEVN